jgi:hypothetical protein
LNAEWVHPICLPSEQLGDVAGRTAVVSGWGTTEAGKFRYFVINLNINIKNLISVIFNTFLILCLLHYFK